MTPNEPTIIENRGTLWPHVLPIFQWQDAVDEIVEELARDSGPRHTCFADPAYRAWYLAARERLRVDW